MGLPTDCRDYRPKSMLKFRPRLGTGYGVIIRLVAYGSVEIPEDWTTGPISKWNTNGVCI